MKLMADLHHADLWESYQLLFGDRMGWEVYAPYGLDWFTSWYWSFERSYHGDAVARQYLEGIWVDVVDKGDHVEAPDRTHPGRVIKGMTLEQARATKWDVVIASVPDNDAGFHRLAKETGGHFGIQMGNAGQFSDWDRAEFGLVSTNTIGTPNKPYVIYRQEFNTHDFRHEWPPEEPNSIGSFLQCFAENKGMERGQFYDQWERLAAAYPEFDWKVYGAYGTAQVDQWACGNLSTTPAVAAGMRKTGIFWHAKYWSDGYGHVIHNEFSVGRPIFAYHSYYSDKLAGALFVPGETMVNLDAMSDEDIVAQLRRFRDDPGEAQRMGDAAAARFKAVVDFDEDAEKVKRLMEQVLG